jgi:methyl-accepting chemotaxis protein
MNEDLTTYSKTAQLGDKTLLGAVVIASAASLALSAAVADAVMGYTLTAALFVFAFAVYGLFKGHAVTRYGLTLALVCLVALHIQLAQGQLEFHFGVFVLLAFLMVYQDWKLVVFGAALFAVHHVVFDRLQAAGLGFYCTTEADFARIVLHATYVIVQAGIEILLVIKTNAIVRQGEQLTQLVSAVNTPKGIALNTSQLKPDAEDAVRLQQCFNRMDQVIQAVRSSADSVEHASMEIASASQDMRERTEQTAQSLESAAHNMRSLSEGMGASASMAAEANDIASKASNIAREGGEEVDGVVSTMDEISQSSRRIAEIIGVIDGIAFQTNILALNAAVEAARAGENGRGFAVVATEVRALAGRSANAAKEIKTLIQASVESVEAGSDRVSRAGATMQSVVQSISDVSNIIHSLAERSKVQAGEVSALGHTIAVMDQQTQQNAAMVEELASSAEAMNAQAREMVETVSEFTRG